MDYENLQSNFVFMGAKNDFLTNNFCVLHRKSCLDRSIYDWITSARYHIPSLSVRECALSFLTYNKIDEAELSLDKIQTTFNRIQKELFEELKQKG